MSSVTSVNQEEEKNPVESAYINLKIKSNMDGSETLFRMKRTSTFELLFKQYCERKSLDFKSIVFLFDERFIKLRQTPKQLEMEEGDQIDAMLHQSGGTTFI